MSSAPPRPWLQVARNALEFLRARPRALVAVQALPVLAIVILFIVTGFRGIDFGYHWDEMPAQILPVRAMAAAGLMFPRWYIYPMFNRWVVLLVALPRAFEAILAGADVKGVQAALVGAFDAPGFLLRVREVFVVLSALAVVWTYGAARALSRTWWEALIAAACIGLSWEYCYHARWVATDTPLVQFAALTLFMLAMYHRRGEARWLYFAAIAAGLGTGTKYPGATLLVPVWLMGVMALPGKPLWPQVRRFIAIGALSFAAYLVTTPATFVDPFVFVSDLKWISAHYKGFHWGYTTHSSWEHWRLALTYLAVEVFSPFRLLAVPLFAASVFGGYVWLRDQRRVGALLVVFPVLFLAFFCTNYTVMIARNYLLVMPFLAVLAARGVAELVQWSPPRARRIALPAALAIALVAQAWWLVDAGESIRDATPAGEAREAIAYVADHPGQRFYLSAKVQALAAQQGLPAPANATSAPPADAFVFFPRAEGPRVEEWNTNDPWLTVAVFGPREVNFNWYSTWEGVDRVVVMTAEKARATGVAFAK